MNRNNNQIIVIDVFANAPKGKESIEKSVNEIFAAKKASNVKEIIQELKKRKHSNADIEKYFLEFLDMVEINAAQEELKAKKQKQSYAKLWNEVKK